MGIKLTNISRKYREQTALNNVNLSFHSKGMVFITGENGSGKTTLLNIIGLIDENYTGEFLFNGKMVSELNKKEILATRARQFNYIFQDNNLIDDLNVMQNLSIYKQIKNIDKEKETLFLEEIKQLNNKYPRMLSGGERQKVSIARGLLDGEILLCDEPTANLDYKSTQIVMEELKAISKSKLVIIVMHSIDLVDKYADRIIELKSGKIIRDDIINFQEEIIINESKGTASFKGSFFPLVFSYFKRRITKTITYVFLISIFTLLLSLFISLLTYNKNYELSKKLITNESIQLSKQIDGNDPFIENKLNINVTQGNTIYSSVINNFSDKEYDYIVNTDLGIVCFTSLLNLKKGEALIDIELYDRLFHLIEFQTGKKIIVNSDEIGFSNMELEIIGIAEKEGIYASKDNLNRNELEANRVCFAGGFFDNKKMYSLSDYFYNRPLYIKLSYLKQVIAGMGYNIDDWELADDEIGVSEGLLEYIDNDDKEEEDIKLNFIDLSINMDNYLSESFIHLKRDVFPSGVTIRAYLPAQVNGLQNFIVVNDNTFNKILTYVPLFSRLSINVINNNNYKVANFFIHNDYHFRSNDTYEYIAYTIPKMILDGLTLIIGLIIIFFISLIIFVNMLASMIFLTKKNEIGLLQTFGFSKKQSLLPSLCIILIDIIFAIFISLLLSPSIYNVINKVVYNMNKEKVPLFIFNYKVNLIMIIFMFLTFVITLLNSNRKLMKYTPKEIFRFN